MPSAGIYIHIPFCRTKCIYCDFYSLPDQTELIPRLCAALGREIENDPTATASWNITTLYIGGGTPSLLSSKQLASILEAIAGRYGWTQFTEITLEANPGEVTAEKLREFRKLGVNRLSLGFQSLRAANLKFLTRIHTVEDIRHIYRAARENGFENIGCDLIFALPGQTRRQWRQDLRQVLRMQPQHISAYALTIETGTPLDKMIKQGLVDPPDEDLSADMYVATQELLSSHGYQQYEVSSYAVPGRECRHNLHYWRGEPYLGFGPSAHGFDGIRRWQNTGDLFAYLDRVENGKSARVSSQTLTSVDITNERVGFGVRTAAGVRFDQLPAACQALIKARAERIREKWAGRLEVSTTGLRLTSAGLAFADAVAVDLLLEPGEEE